MVQIKREEEREYNNEWGEYNNNNNK